MYAYVEREKKCEKKEKWCDAFERTWHANEDDDEEEEEDDDDEEDDEEKKIE